MLEGRLKKEEEKAKKKYISSGIINIFSLAFFIAKRTVSISPFFVPFFQKKSSSFHWLYIFIYRAEKRAAWRQARLKSLEQDAIQAQIMIQRLNSADASDGGDVVKKLDGVEEEEVSLCEGDKWISLFC